MRQLALVFLMAACASPQGPALDPSVTLRPADTAPQAVLDARRHVVAVYVNATCDALPTDSQERLTGFWVNSTTIATAGHAMDVRARSFPDFAIVGPDGCMNGRYADWYEHVDLLFIMASGKHEGAVTLVTDLTPPGETLWQYVFQGRNDLDRSAILTPMRIVSEKNPDSDGVTFGSRPAPAPGDSGAPVFDASGRLVGMTQAIGWDPKRPAFGKIGVHLSSLVIRHYLAGCAGGGPCGDETP
jgi:hypothetical protein